MRVIYRRNRKMCLCRKPAAALFVATLLTLGLSSNKIFAADNSASVVNGNVRFQVLSPSLVRLEYSPKSNFVEEASVAVVGRRISRGSRRRPRKRTAG